MEYIFVVISLLLLMASFLPDFRAKHWFFRIFDFIRLQVLFIDIALILFLLLYPHNSLLLWLSTALLSIAIIYQLITIMPYFPYKRFKKQPKDVKQTLTLLSVNVLQENKAYQKLIALIERYQPDIVLTMETNKAWETALEHIEKTYTYVHKVPLENRYGMHFYTRLRVKAIKTHFLITDDRPAIEALLVDKVQNDFVFWGIHPPPPSPTEKPTSKQKDAELMLVAKRLSKQTKPTIVAGDFNSVCWAKSSKLFAKIAQVKDARLGRGIFGTFPARPSIFRFPIDLIYTKSATIIELKTLPYIDSDHLPVWAEFTVHTLPEAQEEVDNDTKEEVEEVIKEGKKAAVKEEE